MNMIEWKVLLPIIGLKAKEPPIRFDEFSIELVTAESLTSNHQIVVREGFWSNTVLAVKITGEEVSQNGLCDVCPRLPAPSTYQIEISPGQTHTVTKRSREQCICVVPIQQPEKLDVIEVSLKLLEDVLSLVRLFIYIGSRGAYPPHNLISLQRLPHYSDVVGISNKGNGYSENLVLGTRKYDVPLSTADVERWNMTYEFSRIVNIVWASHIGATVNEIDNIIISSLIQFGAMLEEANLKDCFLRGAIAVEAITTPAAGDKEISKCFRGLGATLSTITSHPSLLTDVSSAAPSSARKLWQDDLKRLKEIYKHRCHISHGSERLRESNDETLYKSQHLLVRVATGALLLWRHSNGSETTFYDILRSTKNRLA